MRRSELTARLRNPLHEESMKLNKRGCKTMAVLMRDGAIRNQLLPLKVFKAGGIRNRARKKRVGRWRGACAPARRLRRANNELEKLPRAGLMIAGETPPSSFFDIASLATASSRI